MFNFEEILELKENNRVEFKLAKGGFPKSIWETYSSFANTSGGKIVLGVEEAGDKSYKIVGLTNAEKTLQDFWNGINNSQVVSLNILINSNVQILDDLEKQIVVIDVPRANRQDKPIYVGENPFKGTFRRNGEGDYRCSKEEINNMLRDQAAISQDLKVLEGMGMDVFDFESLKRYRIRLSHQRPGHIWESLEDEVFLQKIGGIARGTEGKLHPTCAGLLMFGHENEIVKEFSNYFLDYQEKLDEDTRWSDRIVSSSGDWSGNLFDFYFKVYNKISSSVKVPFKIAEGTNRVDDTPMHEALREALVNAIIHANYYERQGLVVEHLKDRIIISNPGGFRISIADAMNGGISDPRNVTLVKMFNLISIGDRAGSGLNKIQTIWAQEGFPQPEISESFNPERITLSLSFLKSKKTSDKKQAIKTSDKKQAIKIKQEQIILDYLAKVKVASAEDISKILGVSRDRARVILKDLVATRSISSEGANKNRIYKSVDV
ncbi:MAG: RNA-binding domain-containing protein [Bacillota bacterium]